LLVVFVDIDVTVLGIFHGYYNLQTMISIIIHLWYKILFPLVPGFSRIVSYKFYSQATQHIRMKSKAVVQHFSEFIYTMQECCKLQGNFAAGMLQNFAVKCWSKITSSVPYYYWLEWQSFITSIFCHVLAMMLLLFS